MQEKDNLLCISLGENFLNFHENVPAYFKYNIERPQSCTFVIWTIISHSKSLCAENSYICVMKCTGCFDGNYLVVCSI